MGLLDKKSESKNKFRINEYYDRMTFDWFDYDSVTKKGSKPEKKTKYYFPVHELLKLGIKSNNMQSFNKIINLDLSKMDRFSRFCIRELLLDNNLVNELDRQEMLTYGIKEEHVRLLVEDLDLDTRSINVLRRACNYAWEALKYSLDDIKDMRDCGETTAINIARAYKSLGYTLNGYDEEYYTEDSEINKILNSIHKVEASRTAYVNKINRLNEKIEDADKKLVRLNLELERLRGKNN